MQNKLQELTDKLYNEGLSKGRQEGEEILAKAKAEAEAIIAKADGDRAKVYEIGAEWCAMQCKDLIANGVPAVHFYTMGKSDNIVRILKECF